MKPKFIAVYNGVTFPFNSIKELAVKLLGYQIICKDSGKIDIIINGKEVAHYSEEYTIEEVEKDFFRDGFFTKFTYANLYYYSLMF